MLGRFAILSAFFGLSWMYDTIYHKLRLQGRLEFLKNSMITCNSFEYLCLCLNMTVGNGDSCALLRASTIVSSSILGLGNDHEIDRLQG